jgi:light-regulated signal transduction histidine kinase (bacteriophytochrome)
VSHDLRSPLRTFDGWSLALLEDYGEQLDETALDYIDRMRKESQRMGQLIDDLLNLSRIGRVQLQMKNIDFTKLVGDIFERVTQNITERKIHFTVEPDMEVRGDANFMDVMMTNLISNAVKFTQKRDVAEIRIGKMILDGQEIHFIHDNGAGFNMSTSGKLFGAFQRMHKQNEFPGTGIGLAIVQRIVKAHGGRIWAESEKDIGTTFYFHLHEIKNNKNNRSYDAKENIAGRG